MERYNMGKKIKRKDNFTHQGNMALRKKGIHYVMNNEEAFEYGRCAADILYFAETYCNMELYDFQKEWLENYMDNKFILHNAARQSGISTIYSIIYLWEMTFGYYKNILIVANNGDSAKEVVERVKLLYENLPFFLKCGIIKYTNSEIIFENRTSISYQTRSKYPIVGKQYHIIHILEYAFIPSNYAETLFKSIVPVISALRDTKFIISSTLNGKNHFYKLCFDAKRKDKDPFKNNFKLIETYWWEVPGRDMEWREETIKILGSEDAFNQEYDLQII